MRSCRRIAEDVYGKTYPTKCITTLSLSCSIVPSGFHAGVCPAIHVTFPTLYVRGSILHSLTLYVSRVVWYELTDIWLAQPLTLERARFRSST